jgi:energy-coupling factor transporter ATP-binding protein EcfA2
MSAEPKRHAGESLLSFARRRAEHFGWTVPALPADSSAALIPLSWDADLVPDVSTDRPAEQYEMDAVLERVDIVEAYNRWCGKMHADAKGRTENIMVSCPFPGHEDKNPSVALNSEKNTGMCYRCGEGFDKYTIAAIRFGFYPDYQSRESFPRLREAMAEDLGYTVVVSGKDEWLVKAEPTPAPTAPPEDHTDAPLPIAVAEVVAVHEPDGFDDDGVRVVESNEPRFDWRDLNCIRPGTFLHTWLTITSESHEPEEFYLWEGFMALAAAVGNNVTYRDTFPVRPNLMVCLVGTTGAGKSMAMTMLDRLLRDALPYNRETSSGVRMIGSAGSGEALVDSFVNKVTDTSTGATTVLPVNGLVKESELAGLMKRLGRNGNTIREVLMDLYDRSTPVAVTSRMAGEVEARDHYMQLISSTQPDSIRKLLTDADAAAGFLNRWVFAFGGGKERPARPTDLVDITPAVEPLRHIRSWGSGGRVVEWKDEDAGLLWDEFYEKRVRPLSGKTWVTSRLDLLAKKLVLLFAINDRSTTISKEHVISLSRLWPYLLESYGIIEDRVGKDDMNECMDMVMQYVQDHRGDGVTKREIIRTPGGRRFGTSLVSKAIDILAGAGLIAEVPRAKSDRTTRYTLVTDDDERPKLSVIHGG